MPFNGAATRRQAEKKETLRRKGKEMTEGRESTNQHIIYKHDNAKNLIQQHLKLLVTVSGLAHILITCYLNSYKFLRR